MINKNKMMRIKVIDDLLSTKQYPSKQQIIDKIQEKLYDLYGDEKVAKISPSTIDKDFKDMRYNSAMFTYTADIRYDTKEKGYYYDEEPNFSILKNQLSPEQKADIEILLGYFKDSPLFDYMRESIDSVLATINTDTDNQKEIIQFERPTYYEGSKYLPIIAKCIKEKKKIIFDYNKTFLGELVERTVEPYFLKEFEKRWYLYAFAEYANGMRVFELSRINKLIVKDVNFITEPDVFSPADHFDHVYGVTAPQDVKLQDIILSFTHQEGMFIKTLKIHSSQEIIKETETHITFKFRLYYFEKSYEIIRLVCKYANNIKVIKPESLKQEVISRLKEAISQYE